MLDKFLTDDKPRLEKWKNYYDGKHAIVNKTYTDKAKECNHIVTNFCKIITETYSGYICGKPVSYSSDDNIDDVQECINYNDDNSENIQWLTNALIYGVGYELQWLDKNAQVRYSQVNPLNCFAVFDNSLEGELLYFVRWYKDNNLDYSELHYIEVYSRYYVKTYKADGLGGHLELVKEDMHFFNDIPVSVFFLNENEENIFNSIITLNDAYNELQSSEIDDFNAWVDAYLTITGAILEPTEVAEMKQNRVLLLPDGAQANWLVKNASDTQIVNILDNIKKNIFKVTACPDMADETFLAQSGTALAYKLVGFENVASGIIARFTRAIQRRIELICNILNLKASEAIWRDININFVRNMPANYTELIQLINSLKGTVSDATLLAQLPFVDDVAGELEAVKAQKESNMSLFSFGTVGAAEEEETETTTED
jgi:SPP1 family phage portal protein